MDAEQRQKLGALLAQEHVLVITTQGEEWPTATMQAFAETKDLDIILIMLESSVKFQNLGKRPQVTVLVDTCDTGDVHPLQVIRASIQGLAREVAKNTPSGRNCRAFSSKRILLRSLSLNISTVVI